MVEHMTDDQIEKLPRGGHDYRKVYAAFDAATKHVGQPTVILAKTIKGWTIDALEGKNATHQMKKLTQDDLKKFRDRLYLPITDRDLERAYEETGAAPFFHPGEDAPEIEYMMERRKALGGSLPKPGRPPTPLKLPGDEMYAELKQGSGKNRIATTMAFVRLLKDWMKDPEIGKRIVPIAPDEYRTFGMDSMFPTAKIYNPGGQQYESVDRKLLLSYKESAQGQMLHEGISEAGAMASATAAGSAYSTHGEHMIPFYIFYSMFGFQRTGDSIWAMADQLARGFLIGATAGRTTLTGEGLQHADGHSPLLAATNPAVVHYDPAFAYEVSHIMQDGLRADVRRRRAPARRGRHLLPHRLQRADRPAHGARRRRRRGHPARPLPRGLAGRAARARASSCSPPASAIPWVDEAPGSCSPRSGASPPTPGRSPRGTSWPATRVAAEEWNLLNPDRGPAHAVRHRQARRTPRARSSRSPTTCAPCPADRPLGPGRLPRARHRRLRLRRHPPGRPPLLPRRRRVGRRPGPAGPRRRRRGRREQVQRGLRQATASTTRPPSAASSRRAATPSRSTG